MTTLYEPTGMSALWAWSRFKRRRIPNSIVTIVSNTKANAPANHKMLVRVKAAAAFISAREFGA